MALRILSALFGIAFIAAGVLGYMPEYVTEGKLFGYFEVDSMHNIVHIVSGVIAIMAATNLSYTKLFFRLFGLIYLVVAVLGFWREGDLYIMHVNMADNYLHLGIAVVSLYLGFIFKTKSA